MIGSQQSSVPKGLPMLPGNGFKDPTVTDFKKSHIFDVHQGIPVSHDPSLVAPAASFSGKVAPPRMAPMPTAEIQPVQVGAARSSSTLSRAWRRRIWLRGGWHMAWGGQRELGSPSAKLAPNPERRAAATEVPNGMMPLSQLPFRPGVRSVRVSPSPCAACLGRFRPQGAPLQLLLQGGCERVAD
jgi:hypothetical protein